MKILAIETSCDETAAAVIDTPDKSKTCKVLSSTIYSQIKEHKATGGVVPEVAARLHEAKIIEVIKQSLKKSKSSLSEIDNIAVTVGPGLITSLLVGYDTARTIAEVNNIPLYGINHIESHLYSPFLQKKGDGFIFDQKQYPRHSFFPALSLVVSGGHTELYLVEDFLHAKKLGQTLDDAAGEAFDKIAKMLGLPYPGGPALSALAKKGDPKKIEFPRPMLNSQNLNFSFSGLKTSVLYYLQNHKKAKNTDVAASAEAAITDVLTAKLKTAAKRYQAKTILLSGGVAANLVLREKISKLATSQKLQLLIADHELCTDNATMIGFLAFLQLLKKRKPSKIEPSPSLELN